MTFTDRNEILGRSLFDVFPEDPERPLADGVINLYTSLKANTGKPHAMALLYAPRYGPAKLRMTTYSLPYLSPKTRAATEQSIEVDQRGSKQ